jgi:hypothetical protein
MLFGIIIVVAAAVAVYLLNKSKISKAFNNVKEAIAPAVEEVVEVVEKVEKVAPKNETVKKAAKAAKDAKAVVKKAKNK